MTDLISVVIPTFNRCDMLADALESLFHQETGGEFGYEIVVVDNASADATRETVEALDATSPVSLRYVYQEIPGDAPTRNCGVAEARGNWLAFFDDDQLAAPDWLRQLHSAARQTGAPIVGGAVQLHLPADVLKCLGSDVRHTLLREVDHYPDIRPYGAKQLPGCGNALVARAVFDTIGNFDEAMAWGGSDSDFFQRARRAGMTLCYSPYAIIRHRIPPNRLTTEFFRWDAHQGCDSLASQDFKRYGAPCLILLATARIARGLLVFVPKLAWAWLRGDAGAVLDNRVRLWRVSGYVRRTLALVAPTWFAQTSYFESLKFREGRTVGQPAVEAEAVA